MNRARSFLGDLLSPLGWARDNDNKSRVIEYVAAEHDSALSETIIIEFI